MTFRIFMIFALVFSLTSIQASITDGGPRVSVNGNYGGEIVKGELLKATSLDGCEYVVTSFTMTIVLDDMVVQKFAESPDFTDEMKDLMKKVEPGQKVYFEKIVGKSKAGKEMKLPSLIFVLT